MSSAAAVRYAFSAGRDGGRKVLRDGPPLAAVPTGRVPRIARLLALAHRFQGMLDRGEVASMADIARLGRVSRARVTQIMDLSPGPDIQEELLFLPATESGRDPITLKGTRAVCAMAEWEEQSGSVAPEGNLRHCHLDGREPPLARYAYQRREVGDGQWNYWLPTSNFAIDDLA